jgi:hypothetical protein
VPEVCFVALFDDYAGVGDVEAVYIREDADVIARLEIGD